MTFFITYLPYNTIFKKTKQTNDEITINTFIFIHLHFN